MDSGFVQYLLYDKIYREDILRHAYDLARANAGAPGVDGVSFAMIEIGGVGGVDLRARNGLDREDVPTGTGATGTDPEAWRRRAPARHPDDPGPGGADRCQAGAGADLRGGPRSQRLWLPPETKRLGRDQGSACAPLQRLYRSGRRRTAQWCYTTSSPTHGRSPIWPTTRILTTRGRCRLERRRAQVGTARTAATKARRDLVAARGTLEAGPAGTAAPTSAFAGIIGRYEALQGFA